MGGVAADIVGEADRGEAAGGVGVEDQFAGLAGGEGVAVLPAQVHVRDDLIAAVHADILWVDRGEVGAVEDDIGLEGGVGLAGPVERVVGAGAPDAAAADAGVAGAVAFVPDEVAGAGGGLDGEEAADFGDQGAVAGAGGEAHLELLGPDEGAEVDIEELIPEAVFAELHADRKLAAFVDRHRNIAVLGALIGAGGRGGKGHGVGHGGDGAVGGVQARGAAGVGQVAIAGAGEIVVAGAALAGAAHCDGVGNEGRSRAALPAFVGCGEIAVGVEGDADVAAAQAVGVGPEALRVTDGAAGRTDAEGLAGVVEEKGDAVGAGADEVIAAPEICAERDGDGVAGRGDGRVKIDGVGQVEGVVGQAQPAGAGWIDGARLRIARADAGAGGEDGTGRRVARRIEHPAGGGGILEIFRIGELRGGDGHDDAKHQEPAKSRSGDERRATGGARRCHVIAFGHIVEIEREPTTI